MIDMDTMVDGFDKEASIAAEVSPADLARLYGWAKLRSKDPYMESFMKDTDRGPMRINVWRSERSILYTIGTYLNHPKQGKTQLFRRNVNLLQLEKLFKNPRQHTGKGYR